MQISPKTNPLRTLSSGRGFLNERSCPGSGRNRIPTVLRNHFKVADIVFCRSREICRRVEGTRRKSSGNKRGVRNVSSGSGERRARRETFLVPREICLPSAVVLSLTRSPPPPGVAGSASTCSGETEREIHRQHPPSSPLLPPSSNKNWKYTRYLEILDKSKNYFSR